MISIRRAWLHLASGATVGRVFGFLGNLILSRLLGPSSLGLFNLVSTTVQLSDTLVRCGGDYALNFELGGKPEALQTMQGIKLAQALTQICTLMTASVCIGIAIWVWCTNGMFPFSISHADRFFFTILLLLMVACEGISASAWEVLLVSRRTVQLAHKQGIFVPLRIVFSAVGSAFGGVMGAMAGWTLTSVAQCFWLKSVLKSLWTPLQIWPPLLDSVRALSKRGLPFYASNLLSSIIFYPLLLSVASGNGLAEIGYLRIGQILQQLFAFLPATLVPVLFLKLRGETSFGDQVSLMERPLRLIWLFLIEALLFYCILDRSLILLLFGDSFISALVPTRMLLITALFECLCQLLVQPFLASGKIRIYGLTQNLSAIIAGIAGFLWIPTAGLAAYLIVRLFYVAIPLIYFSFSMVSDLHEPVKMLLPALASAFLFVLFQIQALTNISSSWMSFTFIFLFIIIPIFQRGDILSLMSVFWRTSR